MKEHYFSNLNKAPGWFIWSKALSKLREFLLLFKFEKSKYFAIFPYIIFVRGIFTHHLYFGWLKWHIVFTINT